MSGIAGVLRHDGGPPDTGLLRRMAGALARRGPDGTGTLVDGPAGLVHSLLRATPESRTERQPLADPVAGLALAWDGRLDNRDEIAGALRAAGSPPRGESDADLVLAACAAWGEDAPARLLGDFAFVLWDGRRRRILAARDPMGFRPLFFHHGPRALLFGSEPAVLLEDAGLATRPHEGFAAEVLSGHPAGLEETLFEGIRRLPPGHLLLAERGRTVVRRFWEPRPGPAPADDREAAERLRGLLTEAVRCRLRSSSPVGVDLSGGLDSSSVAAVAWGLVRRGGAPAPSIEAQSIVYPGLPCDETPWIRAVVRGTGIPAAEFPGTEPGPEEFEAEVRLNRDLPDDPAGATARSLLEECRRRGVRVRLDGEGGDEWFGADRLHLADLLRAGRLGTLVRRAREDAGDGGPGEVAAVLWGRGLRPLVPPALRRALRRVRGTATPPPWIARDFARRVGLVDRIREEPTAGPWPTFAQADLWRTSGGAAAAVRAEAADRQASRFGLEVRHPFHDQRLVEWALSLPREQRVRDGVEKVVLRRAMEGLLPPEVTGRGDKADFSVLYARALCRAGGAERFRATALEEAGWIDGRAVRAMARAALPPDGEADPAASRWLVALWRIHGLDLWLRIASSTAGGVNPPQGRAAAGSPTSPWGPPTTATAGGGVPYNGNGGGAVVAPAMRGVGIPSGRP